MVTYLSTADYLASTEDYQEKIARIDKIQKLLFDTAEKAALDDGILSYTLDDGQTKVQTMYKSVDQVINSILALEKLRAMYTRKLGGTGVMRFVDASNLNRSFLGR